MASSIHEADFCAQMASIANALFETQTALCFGNARIEGFGKRSEARKRKDLRFYDRNNKLILCGEVKLPDKPEGRTPFDEDLVRDAYLKADNAGVRYFFTWNVSAFVLWDRQKWDELLLDRRVREWRLGLIVQDAGRPDVLNHIRTKFLPNLLSDVSDILTGKRVAWAMLPDDIFIRSLESRLERPVALTQSWLYDESNRVKGFNTQLMRWMSEEMEWTFERKDPGWFEALGIASRSLAYIWANRLVFYKALKDRFEDLPPLALKASVKTPEAAFAHLQDLFTKAKERTGDYEPLLFPHAQDWASPLVFKPQGALDAWRSVLKGIDAVNFKSVPADVVGHIFQRLISPEERHRHGQHFTGADVVDVINAFCIRGGGDMVLDPACGSGSFLVRAYYRKKTLRPRKPHRELLSEIFGCDIALFPAHLATLNLAAREINDEANYPRIIRKNFFDVQQNKPFCAVPHALGQKEEPVFMPALDAVVGNPPYVRQEKIEKADKKAMHDLVESAWPGLEFSGRSDLHCFFWPSAARLLKKDGYFGFLTSSSWLDVEYGFPLQGWLLKHFKILAIMESAIEPWFPDARIKTCVTILQRCSDEAARMKNPVRFVQFKKHLAEIIGVPAADDEAARQRAVELLRDRIESATADCSDDQLRIVVKLQEELWKDGVRAGRVLGGKFLEAAAEDESNGEDAAEGEEGDASADRVQEDFALYSPNGSGGGGGTGGAAVPEAEEYRAGKWGRYLRAPDFYFEIMRKFGSKFAPLGEICEIRFGIKSGCDAFFMPHDITARMLNEHPDPKEFRRSASGADRKDAAAGRVKIIKAGDGSVHPIEAEYLAPEIHSLMELDRPTVTAGELDRVVLLVNKTYKELKGTWVLRYLKYGETQPFVSSKSKAVPVPKRSTCAGRDPWYDLTGLVKPGFAFWPKAHKYRHIIPNNSEGIICNCRLYDLKAKRLSEGERRALVALLNSTLVGFFKSFYGRYAGTEMTLDTEIVDVNLIEVPNPSEVQSDLRTRLENAFEVISKRPAGYFLEDALLNITNYKRAKIIANGPIVLPEELQQPDRRKLDDAVFELLGVADSNRRKALVDSLYEEVARYFRMGRVQELQANDNKRAGKARRFTADELAADVWDGVELKEMTPLREWLDGQVGSKAAVHIPAPTPAKASDAEMFDRETVYFGKDRTDHLVCASRSHAELIAALANLGINGDVELPQDAATCRKTLAALEARLAPARQQFETLAENRTGSDALLADVVELLMHWYVHGKPTHPGASASES